MISTDTDKEISLIYFSIRFKFCIALIGACLWTWFSIWIAQAWIHDLSTHIGICLLLFF